MRKLDSGEGRGEGGQGAGENISRTIPSLSGRSVRGEKNTSGGTWQGAASSSTPAPLQQPHRDCCSAGGGRGLQPKYDHRQMEAH